jgi:hypothetical protein
MDGYPVITSDDCKVGHVVGEVDDNLIVEHGAIFKTRRALPRSFAHVDEAEHVVRTTISKQIFDDSPKLEGDDVDENAVAEHYGLVAGETGPETLGYGDVTPDDPARTAEDDRVAAGLSTPEEDRLRTREHMREGPAGPPSPGLLGSRNPRNDR